MSDVATAAPHIVGIRHLSPAGARCVRDLLDRVQPTMVLIEGPADVTGLIDDITARSSRPPIAVLAYTSDLPVRTFCSPFASYSPEYQALMWACEQEVEARFIDLPSDIFLAIGDTRERQLMTAAEEAANGEHEQGDDTEDTDTETEAAPQSCIYDEVARRAGADDYESYWERDFERLEEPDAYRRAALAFGEGLRAIDSEERFRAAETQLREAHMRRCIRQALADGHEPERIVVIVGAFHASVLGDELPPLSDDELASLPRRESKLTLMPYSYFKLSSQSGYGAGNHAPAYFELQWQLRERPDDLAPEYLTRIAQAMREIGSHRSCASVIEGTRLAEALAALGGHRLCLRDLRDAAVTLLGLGDPGPIAEALARVEIGTAIGELAEGVSQTAIQDDFIRQLRQLHIADYRGTVAKDLQLDLRENRRVKSEEAAFRDLNRSTFLHRLRCLGIPFATLRQQGGSDSHTWAEHWVLQWSPEAEIALVEAVLLGETVEVAAAYRLRRDLEESSTAAACAAIVRRAGECDLPSVNRLAVAQLRDLATEDGTFDDLAGALAELHALRRYGDVRKLDHRPLEPLITQLFLQASLRLFDSANCDEAQARRLMAAMGQVDEVGEACAELVDGERWLRILHALADADDRSPLLSGYACAILCERGHIEDEELAREVSRRLSPGIAADLGAGWFEGLAQRNRYALLTRLALWRQLAEYIASLDDEQYRRALVFLRRSFGAFSPQEKRSIAENLGEIWGIGSETASELIDEELSADEQQQLDELDDFDFEDL